MSTISNNANSKFKEILADTWSTHGEILWVTLGQRSYCTTTYVNLSPFTFILYEFIFIGSIIVALKNATRVGLGGWPVKNGCVYVSGLIMQGINQHIYFHYLVFACGLRKPLKLIGIWARRVYYGLLINPPGPESDFEKSRSVNNYINRVIA